MLAEEGYVMGMKGRKGLYHPSRERFIDLASTYNLITIMREVESDLETPVSAFMKLEKGDFSFLLESAERGERWGRFSFLGFDPLQVITYQDGEIRHQGRKSPFRLSASDPVSYLFQTLAFIHPSPVHDFLPFVGGAVGYFGYDLLPFMEKIEFRASRVLDIPEMMFMLTGKMAVFDHLQSRLYLVVSVLLSGRETPGELRQLYDRAILDLEEMAERLRRPLSEMGRAEVFYLSPETYLHNVIMNMGEEAFQEKVERALEYIHAGEAFQIVLSQRFDLRIKADCFSIYRSLRSENPSPYMFYLKFEDLCLAGSSPESVVTRRGECATIRPIAGTRKRGETVEEDIMLEEELLEDEKERAEHIMLVDLARNDLGRVCAPGSVEVTQLMEVERYSQVMHLVSEVRGRLRKGIGNDLLLRACFPAGTVSGAPKVRACQIIDELEMERRGIYAGAVGYVGYSGSLDTCIAIRTLVAKGDRACVQAGAGVVADSKPEREYQETMDKARALLRAVRRAEAAKGV